jgi:translation initiation factor IF-3
MRDRRINFQRGKQPQEKFAINEQITAPEVRLIGEDGTQHGVLRLSDALRMAEDGGVDLVEVAPEARPPVCRLLDYGKLKYREQKKAAEARKKTAVHVVKELRIRYSTDKHDLETKVRSARKFLVAGDRVRFQMRFRGREVTYQELGIATFKQVVEMLSDVAVVEEKTGVAGMRMSMTLAPKGQQAAGKPAAPAGSGKPA